MVRRLAAVMIADVVGYSRLMGLDDSGTLQRLTAVRQDVLDPRVGGHNGRIVKLMGDGVLAEFSSVIDAVACAVDIQRDMAARNAEDPEDKRIVFRIGIDLGDLIFEDGDVFGDGVNVAARLQAVAEPGGVLLSGDAYRQVRGRVALPIAPGGSRMLHNIAEPIEVYAVDCGPSEVRPPKAAPLAEPSANAQKSPLLEPQDKPSLAILPFDNLSRDPAHECLADGVVEELTAALSRVRSFFVIARNSAYAYKGRAADVRQIARELGVRYLMEGSVQCAGPRLRITAQLISGADGMHLWSGHVDGEIGEIFELQDRLAEQVVGAIQPSIHKAEIERVRRKRTESLGAYDFTMRALPHVWALERADNLAALDLLGKALALDPNYPLALALTSWCHGQQVVYQWTDDPAPARAQCLKLAEAAARVSDNDPFVLTALAAAHTIVRNHGTAAVLLERALSLDPNLALAWNRSGWHHVYRDDAATAITHFDRALRLSPLDPMTFNCYLGIGEAHFVDRRYGESMQWMAKALAVHPGSIWIYRSTIPALVFLDRMEEAKRQLTALRTAYPEMTVSGVRNAMVFSDEVMGRICDGLKRAGLPED